MHIEIMPSTLGGTPGHALHGLRIDSTLAVDAGGLGFWDTLEAQAQIADILLTHAHVDHIAGLPIFLDNVYQLRPQCPTVHALPATLNALQDHIFNNAVMPDFLELGKTIPPFVSFSPLEAERPFTVQKYTVTALPLQHAIPTVGYLIDDGVSAIAVITDTLPMPKLWPPLSRWPRLKAVFLECSFPMEQQTLAHVSHHLTTAQFGEAAQCFDSETPIFAIHIKPRYINDVVKELKQLGLAHVQIGHPGKVIQLN